MSKKLEVKRGERLHELREGLLDLAISATEHFFQMGEIMKEIREKELWRESYDGFRAFYSDPELGFKKSSVNHAIKLVNLFPKWKSVLDVHVSKLIMIAPHIQKENKKELLSMARALSKSDLHHQLTLKRLVEKDPEIKFIPKVFPCKVCYKARGIDWDSMCHCGMTSKQIEYISKLIKKVRDGSYEL